MSRVRPYNAGKIACDSYIMKQETTIPLMRQASQFSYEEMNYYFVLNVFKANLPIELVCLQSAPGSYLDSFNHVVAFRDFCTTLLELIGCHLTTV